MCGISGFIDFSISSSDQVLENMITTLNHRGPDYTGKVFEVKENYQLGLAHKRLSIIDVSNKAHQPMSFEQYTIVFNGEVYNFKEVRKLLEIEGYDFTSESDTEVILKAWHKWGEKALTHFRGMWAFAIWDKNLEELTLCTDRVGVKPLYWSNKNNLFLFSSELKAFLQHPNFEKSINKAALKPYFKYGHITSPLSIFKNANKLAPGTILTINSSGNVKQKSYWKVDDHFLKQKSVKKQKKSEDEVLNELEDILTESFNLRMVSDVPVGVFLSGGIDSSLVTALLQKNSKTRINTFSIGFKEPKYDESKWAYKVAEHLKTNHTEYICTANDALNVINEIIDVFDEPFGGPSAIPTLLVSKLAKKHVKVVLSADGGDEQFFGYDRYIDIYDKIEKLNKFPYNLASSIIKKYESILPIPYKLSPWVQRLTSYTADGSFLDKYDKGISVFSEKELKKLGVNDFYEPLYKNVKSYNSLSFRNQMMCYDINQYLPNQIMTKVDRASMACSIEAREPFLDHKVLEFSSSLPLEYKYKNGSQKYLLKKLLNKYVPKELTDRPKQGFGLPIDYWIKNELKDTFINQLSTKKLKKQGILNHKEVVLMLENYLNGKLPKAYARKLWYIYIFSCWQDKYL